MDEIKKNTIARRMTALAIQRAMNASGAIAKTFGNGIVHGRLAALNECGECSVAQWLRMQANFNLYS